MRDQIEKFVSIEREISQERGEFSLFALFLREGAPDRWDLVVSAPWFGADEKQTLEYFARKLRSRLRPQDLVRVSRIVLLDPTDAGVKSIQQAIRVEHGTVQVTDRVFFGLHIQQGYIITSKRETLVPAAAD